jgi:MFS family permease
LERQDPELKNFIINVINGTLTKLGDQLVSPQLVLTWLLEALGVSASIIGALVPVRKSFALVPQLIVSGRMRTAKIRKYFWMTGAIAFGVFIGLIAPAVSLFSESSNIGWIVLGLLSLASLSRGVSSIAFKEVVGKTISSGKRGRLLALRATSGGLLALLAGILLRYYLGSEQAIMPFYYLIGAGALVWVLGGLLVGLIKEEESAPDEARYPLDEIKAGYKLLKENKGLRRFVWVRCLFIIVQLSTPFYVLYARQYISQDFGNLAFFVIIVNLAKVLSSPLWGRFSDRSSRTGMMLGGGLAVLVGILAFGVDLLPPNYQNVYVLGGLLLLLGFSQSGIRLGRKTYLLDVSPEDERPLFAAVTNLIVGTLTFLSGGLGIIVDIFNVQVLILFITIIPIFGIFLTYILPEAR